MSTGFRKNIKNVYIILICIFAGIIALCIKFAAGKAFLSYLKTDSRKEIETIDDVCGTYCGNNGSVMILRDNMTADYFYPDFGMYTDNSWDIDDGEIVMTLPCLDDTEIRADIEDNSQDQLYFTGEDGVWDNELFYKANSSQDSMTGTQAISLLKSYFGIEDTEETAEAAESTSEPTSSLTISDEVTPEFKETMDSIAEMCDDYVSFMLEYGDDDFSNYDFADAYEILAEYNEILVEYQEMQDAISSIDEDSLTTADYVYMMEVMARVEAEMAAIN